ncbi:MAG: hypothetical protein L0H83_01345 [Salinisphaera sp.]|nr:hypothetical protein [Salinisphaera sp.]
MNDALANAWLTGGSLKSLLDGCVLHCYSGTAPITADEAVDVASTRLLTVDVPTTGVSFATPAVGRSMTAAGLKGTGIATGALGFFRLCTGTDDGSGVAGALDYRIQGSITTVVVGTGELQVPTLSVTASSAFDVDAFSLSAP